MVLDAAHVIDRLEKGKGKRVRDPLVISPYPQAQIDELRHSGSASIDLRLGCWFVTLREARMSCLDVGRKNVTQQRELTERQEQLAEMQEALTEMEEQPTEVQKRLSEMQKQLTEVQERLGEMQKHLTETQKQFTDTRYVRFNSEYYLHPGSFVLGITFEWLRLPRDLTGSVIGRSSWGRRGLIIATATGVHPGFTGCLTLELTNVAEIPIKIKPGLTICQLFLHQVKDSPGTKVDPSQFAVQRKPVLGQISPDEIAEALAGPPYGTQR